MSKKRIYIHPIKNAKEEQNEQYRRVQKQLHADKDSAINSLWQRSILLVSLLVICYTGYGTLFMKYLDDSVTKKYSICYNINNEKKQSDITITDNTNYKIWRIHLALLFISFVGCILSMLWILMAKGSKAWQEAHENAISDLEYLNLYKNLPYDGEHGKWKIKMDSYSHGWWQGGYLWLDEKKVSDCILNTKLACYSPSKINIMIGIVSFFIFSILCLIHIMNLCSIYFETNLDIHLLIACLVLFCALLIAIIVSFHSMKSSSLSSKVVTKDSKRDKRCIEFTQALEKVILTSRKLKKKRNNKKKDI